jgi:hypothetical protein
LDVKALEDRFSNGGPGRNLGRNSVFVETVEIPVLKISPISEFLLNGNLE